uniref:Uncharacterized protein n=1 Tax=Aegilops tauschii subsp. strangulata TaxID=200361 RepID=A0A453DW95_AEGTS
WERGRRSVSFLAPAIPAATEEDRLFVPQPARSSSSRRRSTGGELSGDDDEGAVDGGAAAGGDGLLRRAAGLVHGAAARLDGGREQAVRAGAGRARPAQPGLGQGGARHRQDGPRGRRPLQEPRARRPPDRVRHLPWPRLRPRRRRLHPAVGRQRGPRRGRGLPARLPVRRLRRREAARRPHAGAGEEEGGAVDRGRAQVVPPRPEEVRQRGLEEHFAQLRADEDADAGGQPRAEVLHQAQLRRRQGQEAVEHPRHHHGAPRRPAPLAVPVIHDHPVQRTGSERDNRAVLSAS